MTIQEVFTKLIRESRFQIRDRTTPIPRQALLETKGLMHSIVLRPVEKGKFEVVAGNRRFKRLKEDGQTKIVAEVRRFTDTEAKVAGIIENLAREEYGPLEEAKAIDELYKASFTGHQIARLMDVSDEEVSRRRRLLRLPDQAKEALRKGSITVSHLEEIAPLKSNPLLYQQALQETLEQKKTISQLHAYVEGRKPLLEAKARIDSMRTEQQPLLATVGGASQVRPTLPDDAVHASMIPAEVRAVGKQVDLREFAAFSRFPLRASGELRCPSCASQVTVANIRVTGLFVETSLDEFKAAVRNDITRLDR